ncbi:MAG: D-alanine--D-alanine ligase [Chloroflexi bacterium]|nr:D-alanine--D-alanine ligase [Chloroflexota bacterium]
MRIGLSYDLKEAVPLEQVYPEDALEEYDSLETVGGIAAAIEAEGHATVKLGGGRDFLARILKERVDLVFNIAEGLGNYRSRESQIPAVLEMLNIPYSGSDPQTLSVCLDKPLTKKLVASAGVNTPGWLVIDSPAALAGTSWAGFPFPAFVKPAWEGSSKGIRRSSLAETPEKASELVKSLLDSYCQPVMVEEFISGDEVTVGVAGNSPPEIIGVMRIVPRKQEKYFVYSLEVKRDWEALVDYECPARLSADTLSRIRDASLKAFGVLGCRDFSRLDFRLSHTGKPYFLEINPLPGLNPKSGDIVIMAKKMGWTYQKLIGKILNTALERYPQCVQK